MANSQRPPRYCHVDNRLTGSVLGPAGELLHTCQYHNNRESCLEHPLESGLSVRPLLPSIAHEHG